jgi:predicted RNase H-like HicB family nuclease
MMARTSARVCLRESRDIQGCALKIYEEHRMTLTIEFDREDDGRWIAEIPQLPGVLVYGANRDEALARVKALALRELADRFEHGEPVEEPISFAA